MAVGDPTLGMIRIGRPAFGLVASALAVTALAACGGGTTLNRTQIEQLLSSQQQKSAPNLTVSGTTCPSGIKAKVGTHFSCTLKISGITVTYNGNVDSVSSSKGHVMFEPANPIIDVGKLTDGLKQSVGSDTVVECGPTVQQLPIGALISCNATSGGQSQTVQFKVMDKDGTVQPVDNSGSATTVPADTTTVAPSDSGTTAAP